MIFCSSNIKIASVMNGTSFSGSIFSTNCPLAELSFRRTVRSVEHALKAS